MFSKYCNYTLVPDTTGDSFGFGFDLIHVEAFAFFVGVIAAEATVKAVVNTIVAAVEWRECDDAVIVDLVLDTGRHLIHFLPDFRIFDLDQGGKLFW